MTLEILLVEDNPGDVRLAREAFRKVNRDVHLHVAGDGVEAMAFLKRQGGHADAPRPALILLDLNLPRLDGREVLDQIKQDDELKAIPTVILSTSDAATDIDTIYQRLANCLLTKPVLPDDLDRIVGCINEFWRRNAATATTAVH
jgi:two-component system, chemotaxis family, response regulator Rcp1